MKVKSRKRKSIRQLLMPVVLVWTVLCISIGIVAVATVKDEKVADNIYVTVSSEDSSEFSNNVLTVTVAGEGGCNSSSDTAEITIKNTSEVKAKISFVATKTDCHSVTINNSDLKDGLNTVTLEGGTEVTITMTTESNGTKNKLELSGFLWEQVLDSSEVTVLYNDALGNVTVGGTAVANNGVVTIAQTTDFVATAKSGNTFLGWVTLEEKFLSKEATCTVESTGAQTIKAVFVKTTSDVAYFNNGTYLSSDLNKVASAGGTVTLVNNGILSAGDYTIPDGVQFLIPYSATDTGTFGAIGKDSQVSTSAVSTFRTLTVPAGTTITCYGEINVNGQRRNTGQDTGTGNPRGSHGKLVLNGAGTQLSIESGGALYAYGFVAGSGGVEVKSQGTMHEMMQVYDWPGGQNFAAWIGKKNVKNVFFTSRYFIQNVEAPVKFWAGATAKLEAVLYVTGLGAQATSSTIIGDQKGLFIMGAGTYVTRTYDASTDRVEYVTGTTGTSGNITFGGLEVSASIYTLKSEEYTLPLNNAITLRIGSGTTVNMGSRAAILPSAKVIVEEKATLNLSNHLYIFDKVDWTSGMSFGSTTAPLYTAGRGTTAKLQINESGLLQVDGTLNISGDGGIYTTVGITTDKTTSNSADKMIKGTGTIIHAGAQDTGSLRAGYSGTLYDLTISNGLANLAGLGTMQPFSNGGAVYYGLGEDYDNHWYQYVIQAEGEGITAIDFGDPAGYVDGVRYTKTDGTTGTKDNVVGYSVSGGQFDFTVADRMVFLDNDGAYYKAGKNTMGNAETGITKDMVLTRAVAQVVDSDAAADASEMYYATLSAAASAYADSATFGGSVQEGGVSDYIRMWAGSTADATLCNEAVLDLNGYGVKGVAASGTLYGMDSATNGYETGGSLVLKSGTPEAYTNMDTSTVGYTYLAAYDEETDTYTFNRFDITVTDYYLELYADGSYKPGFAVTFRGNGNVQKQLSQMGIRVEEDKGKPYWGDVDSAKLTNCYTGYYTSEIVEDYADYTATGLLRFVDMDVSEWWESKPAILNVKNTVVDYYTTLKKAIAAWNDGASEVTYTDDQIENMEKSMALIEKFATEHSFQGSLSAGTT